MNIPKIKMLILDVDGTMTDNGIYIDENGVESKRYNAKDGVGIYELIKNNIKIGIISHSEKGDGINQGHHTSVSNTAMWGMNLKIKFYSSG